VEKLLAKAKRCIDLTAKGSWAWRGSVPNCGKNVTIYNLMRVRHFSPKKVESCVFRAYT
jgi:hypothetical protein